jgi:hypothetical protein
MSVVTEAGVRRACAAGRAPSPKPGQTAISLVRPAPDERAGPPDASAPGGQAR